MTSADIIAQRHKALTSFVAAYGCGIEDVTAYVFVDGKCTKFILRDGREVAVDAESIPRERKHDGQL